MATRPLIGITTDVITHEARERCAMYPSYARAIVNAGGTPVLLTQELDSVPTLVARLDGFLFSGGDDPVTESFGQPTDPRVTRLHPARQEFEVALLRALERNRPEAPVLGVCLGMQLMALVAGGKLNQHMPSLLPTADLHWEREHEVRPEARSSSYAGRVLSRHKQAVDHPGRLQVLARAEDGVIEAIGDPARRFYVGVQWHPERTRDAACGRAVLERLVHMTQSG